MCPITKNSEYKSAIFQLAQLRYRTGLLVTRMTISGDISLSSRNGNKDVVTPHRTVVKVHALVSSFNVRSPGTQSIFSRGKCLRININSNHIKMPLPQPPGSQSHNQSRTPFYPPNRVHLAIVGKVLWLHGYLYQIGRIQHDINRVRIWDLRQRGRSTNADQIAWREKFPSIHAPNLYLLMDQALEIFA